MKNGKMIMIDGIGGSGKTTIIHALKEWMETQGKSFFDLQMWSKENRCPPCFEEVKDHDVFFTFEPTRTWIGEAIRFELAREDDPYGAVELAHAFALDRQIMYKRLIIPALEHGKIILQDRGISTSLIYQPIMKGGITIENLLEIPGNALAMKYAPDHLILTDLDSQKVVERLSLRSEESKGVFTQLPLLKQASERFHSAWFAQLFESYGTCLHCFRTDLSTQTMIKHIKLILANLLNFS